MWGLYPVNYWEENVLPSDHELCATHAKFKV